ncbi:MAG TPA: hypothetical protein VE422_47135 [Terriglobia bacterium]|nr:hypothetical protein [Terriglobia bacterium]
MTRLDDDLDALFELPLTEFTAARNALAAQLKKAGNASEAERAKALVKPPISAWAVNQLYWKHGDAFKDLLAAGERLGPAHASQLAGKGDDMRGLLAARREAVSDLARLAAALLLDAGHNPTPDTMRRITTTLEALSTYSSFSDGPRPGRLTADVDPPGFDSIAALIPSIGRAGRPDPSRRPIPFRPPSAAASPPPKAALQAAERALRKTRTMAQEAAAALKKATARLNETEKHKREAEKRFEKARAAAEEARQRLQSVTAEAEKAARALQFAERDVEKARQELEAGGNAKSRKR